MNIQLLNIDCMAFMATCKDKEFDLAIVDPPYGSSIMCKNKYQRHKTTDTIYRNKSIPPPEYYTELTRISTEQIIWGCQYMMPFLNPEGSFIIWDKGADPDMHNMSACDVAWYSKRERIRKFFARWCGAVKCESEETIHIHQKPMRLYRWLLRHYAKPGDKILDTHGGSFSSAIAIHQMNQQGMNLSFVGCEIVKDYYDAAMKRFNLITSQKELFEVQK
jgi:site-specific DNA-methyltransferase (adenine-specific)